MSIALAGFVEIDDLLDVEIAIEGYFDDQVDRAARLGDGYRGLWEAARRASSGGKKLRPALLMATHRALGGDRTEAAIEVATAFELLHTAFLLHDDVIDGDVVRRGQPNLAGARINEAVSRGVPGPLAESWGQASAILAGDLLIHAAQGLIARAPVPEPGRLALLDLLDRCVFVTAAGELADVAFATGVEPAALADTLAMAETKTASYTFEGPLIAGALLAAASADVVAGLGEFATTIGTAFQLRDDLLGVFGSEETTGKSSINDLRGRKLTPLMSYAQSTPAGPELARLLDVEPFDDGAAGMVRELLIDCGAYSYVEGLVAQKVRRAIEQIETAPFPASLRAPLRKIVVEATERVA